MSTNNQEWIFASYPEGQVTESNMTLQECEASVCEDGQVLVQSDYLSVDPYMRGRMREAKSYMPGFKVGEAMAGGGVGVVLESKAEGFVVGDTVTGMFPWRKTFATAPENLTKVDATRVPPVKFLSALGMVGMTAYWPVMEIGQPKEGEKVFVSGAAGAVGSLVGQICKNLGLYVVGSAGSDEKVAHLRELGFDQAFNYKTRNSAEALDEYFPEGIDIYYDNVGGEVLDFCLARMNTFGRIICCGMISQYNLLPEEVYGLKNTMNIVGKQLRMEGFIVTKYAAQFGEGIARLAAWMAEGKLRSSETVHEGFDQMATALVGLFSGANTGKMVVHVGGSV